MAYPQRIVKHNNSLGDSIDAYLSSVTMAELLGKFGVSVNCSGMILCPIHSETTPSAKVYDSHLYCFGCGVTLSRPAYVSLQLFRDPKPRGDHFWGAMDWLAGHFGLPTLERDPEAQAKHEAVLSNSEIYEQVWAEARKNRKPGIDYLVKRGISKALAEEYAGHLPPHYQPPYREQSEIAGLYSSHHNFLFRGRCVIPIRHQGKIVNLYGRALKPETTPSHIYCGATSPQMPQTLWGLDEIRSPAHIYIAESIIDALSMWTHGFTNTVAAFGSRRLSDEQIQLLKRRGVKKVTIAFDTDGPNE